MPFLMAGDTLPKSGAGYMQDLLAKIEEIGVGKVATVSGRYYAMDRDNRWERTKKAYDVMVLGEGIEATDPYQAIEDSYATGVNDEFVVPVVIKEDGKPVATIRSGDTVVFFNFRADRARQLTRALALKEFEGF